MPHSGLILKLARKSETYRGKCKLEGDSLIITGTKYTVDSLDKFPDDLPPYKAAQKLSQNSLIFHGSLTLLSNFHQSPFTLGINKFHSAEHYIQYQKACHFNDYRTAEHILHCKTPIDAKALSHNIVNSNKDAWNSVTKEACQPGISANFEQNPPTSTIPIGNLPLKTWQRVAMTNFGVLGFHSMMIKL